jgi:hypothetical protein
VTVIRLGGTERVADYANDLSSPVELQLGVDQRPRYRRTNFLPAAAQVEPILQSFR